MKTWIQTAIIAVMFLTAHSGTFADEPKPGDKVAAKWGAFSYYIATITSVEANGKYSVKYGDGDTGVVAPGDVEPVDAARELPIGTRVLACLNGVVMYPGTITARRDNRYTVKWDDEDAPREIERDRIAPVRPPARAMPAAGALAVGTGVAAKWGQVSFYIATIEGMDASGKYLVNYGDGDRGPVAPADVVPVSAAEPIAVGAHVLACWAGARMYSGTVTARNGDRYTVKWDDGSAPSEVARDRMAMPRLEAAAAVPAGGLAIGTSVAAKWGAGSYYIATIKGGAEGGKFRVEYGDGDTGDVAADDMVRVDADRGIAVGARVLACWSGPRMYSGTVTMRTQDRYTVKWDDGSTPSEVPREKIALLPGR